MTKKHFLLSMILSLIIILFNLGCSSQVLSISDIACETTSQGMLVMIYVAGANNLCDEAYYDINQMEKGLSLASEIVKLNLKVVVLFDSYSGENSGYSGFSGTRLYEIQSDDSTLINSTIIQTASSSLGTWRTGPDDEEAMGDITTLENFVVWATENYPNYQKQSLILWNHGGGVWSNYSASAKSVCSDEESGAIKDSLDNLLYIGEISDMLSKYYNSSNKLDFLGFDACFMGMYEICYQFRDLVDYMAVSPASEYGGWNYEYIFQQYSSIKDGKNFAINVVDGYRDAYNKFYNDTMTAVDLTKISELKLSIDQLAQAISDSAITKNKLDELRNNSVVLHENDVYLENNIKSYPYYELGSLLALLSSSTNGFSTEVQEASINVQDILSQVVLKTWLSSVYGGRFAEEIPYGLSIFFTNSDDFSLQGFYTAEKTGTVGVLGYGSIDAANTSDDSKTNTWYELMCEYYAD